MADVRRQRDAGTPKACRRGAEGAMVNVREATAPAEARGITRDASDFNPLKVFRSRK